jgi:hypothetical protein
VEYSVVDLACEFIYVICDMHSIQYYALHPHLHCHSPAGPNGTGKRRRRLRSRKRDS